jgi:hypothetical protein
MNTCPVYRRSGGLSYGATYSGPIGLITIRPSTGTNTVHSRVVRLAGKVIGSGFSVERRDHLTTCCSIFGGLHAAIQRAPAPQPCRDRQRPVLRRPMSVVIGTAA